MVRCSQVHKYVFLRVNLFLFFYQEFKSFVLLFALFAVAASGATVCKCGEEKKKVKLLT